MKQQCFHRDRLAFTISVVLGVTGIPSVLAMEDEPLLEEVTVTGIRASLKNSMDVKRDSAGVVDAISAEDMGKFPDSNLAESLQRISGVSIDRRNGEGSRVTVRGFGPDYNLITLNGRQMPSTSLVQNGGGVSQGRAFDMDNLAAESVRALEVYKTGRADIASGGMGATINIITQRPLDRPGLNMSLGAKVLRDTTNVVGDDYTPEAAGLFSWTDEGEKLGFALTASYQQRDSGASGAYTNNWITEAYDGTIPQSPGENSGEPIHILNEPELGELRSLPIDLRYIHSDRERTRINGQLTLQWRPIDTLTGTVDYTYARQDIYENRSELSAWMDTYKSDIAFDRGPVYTPALYWEERREQNPRDIGLALQQQNQVNTLKSLGLNLLWQPGDEFELVFDAHQSESSSLPDAGYGNWINIGLGANISAGQGIDFTGDGLPILLVDFDDGVYGNGNGKLEEGEVGSSVRQIFNDRAFAEFTQARLGANFVFNETHSIDFGIESRDMETRLQSSFYQELLAGGWGIANPGDVPAEYLSPINYAKLFNDYNLSLGSNSREFFDRVSDGRAAPLLLGYTGNAALVGRHLSNAVGLPWAVNPVDNLDRTVHEAVYGAYTQYYFSTDWRAMPVNLVVGLRYEKTGVESTDLANLPSEVVWQSNNDFQIPAGATATPYSEKAKYNHWLPNMDFDIEFIPGLIGRFSYSKTIARANYDQMGSAASGLSGPSLPTLLSGSTLGTAGSGNPGILPLESDNLDLSLEWYFDASSYVSMGYFRKDVDNFIGTATVDVNLYGLSDPTNGPRALQAMADLTALGEPLNDTNLFSMVAANILGVDFYEYTAEEFENLVDVTGNADDAPIIFRVSQPKNSERAVIDGWEVGVQHFLGETGFGLQANYTIVNGDIEYDVEQDPAINGGEQFALTGLSDTANVSLIFEQYGLSARLSYNWRDAFLAGVEDGGRRPRYTEEYSQVDLSIGYEVHENLKLSLDGINLLGEDQRQFARSTSQLLRIEMLGPRYALSARYHF
ncbi:TonB-dependent receptor [Microbulbifer spongiae]|uniref:TonB-dependent receptor n=1 Tax=Microbulbifer spongiae TaxID=2944933 RepID=A0ABY9EC95_9GAMM|nr:TonB-dependent receptor [Microbulbifer sp. MI-G]WKD50649.1 TonB-dependent receptor [Microbulbifer sp. MI-G]